MRALGDAEVIRFGTGNLNLREDGAAKVAQRIFNLFVEAELCHMELFARVPPKALKQARARPVAVSSSSGRRAEGCLLPPSSAR